MVIKTLAPSVLALFLVSQATATLIPVDIVLDDFSVLDTPNDFAATSSGGVGTFGGVSNPQTIVGTVPEPNSFLMVGLIGMLPLAVKRWWWRTRMSLAG